MSDEWEPTGGHTPYKTSKTTVTKLNLVPARLLQEALQELEVEKVGCAQLQEENAKLRSQVVESEANLKCYRANDEALTSSMNAFHSDVCYLHEALSKAKEENTVLKACIELLNVLNEHKEENTALKACVELLNGLNEH